MEILSTEKQLAAIISIVNWSSLNAYNVSISNSGFSREFYISDHLNIQVYSNFLYDINYLCNGLFYPKNSHAEFARNYRHLQNIKSDLLKQRGLHVKRFKDTHLPFNGYVRRGETRLCK